MDTRHLDQALAGLDAHKTQWARLPIQDKISYLKQIRQLALTHAQRWADAQTKAEQLTPGQGPAHRPDRPDRLPAVPRRTPPSHPAL